MTELAIIGVLYGLVLLSFSRLGGFAAAARALRDWGGASGRIERATPSSN